ncbi:NUDIX hydrolase [Lacrimispora amygdalina]|uniref:NUDIX hydrolase n=1 Tax=Lacrimispora amygdalina TaxID=253257 RepID=UPI000BE22D25|nr:NUDIX hydrolase [Lacrimispora amygdalina]
MKVLKEIMTISEGWLNKYLFHYIVDGKDYNYEVVSRNKIKDKDNLPISTNAVTIIPFTKDGKLIITKEFRYAVNDYVWEFPAGLIDEGETPIDSAIREMKEETGLDVIRIYQELPGAYSSVGMTDEKVAVVICKVDGVVKGSTGKEEIYVYKKSIKEVSEMIINNKLKVSGRMQLFLAGLNLGNIKID